MARMKSGKIHTTIRQEREKGQARAYSVSTCGTQRRQYTSDWRFSWRSQNTDTLPEFLQQPHPANTFILWACLCFFMPVCCFHFSPLHFNLFCLSCNSNTHTHTQTFKAALATLASWLDTKLVSMESDVTLEKGLIPHSCFCLPP